MPYDLGSETQSSQPDIAISEDFKRLYEDSYPNGLDLKPGSPLHTYIVTEVMARARQSKTVMSNRYDSWREMDHVMTAYVKLDKKERELRGSDPRKPASLVIPMAYATREVILTYETSAFIDELPYFRYTNMGPEDVVGTALLEKVVEAQNRRMKVGLGIYTQLSDGWTYGLGPAVMPWRKKYGKRRFMQEEGYDSYLTGQYTSTGSKEVTEDELLFEGTGVENIDPYMYLPDTTVPGHLHQDGEFVGYVDTTNRTMLLKEEKHNPKMFNVRYINRKGARSSLATDQTGRGTRTGMTDIWSPVASSGGSTDVIWMWIDLVPSEWMPQGSEKPLGDGDYPEKWMFGVAGDGIVIMAHRADLDHGMYPTTCAVPTFDGRSVSPVSGIEMISELQRVTDWFVSSHVTNVRKVLNDMFLVDPLLVNINDFINPGPGRLIRMRKSRWGQGTKDAIQQLQVQDVTQQHMRDAEVLMNIAQRILGINENMQGGINSKRERISADETKGSRMFGTSRQAAKARLLSEQFIWDTAYIMAKQTQQFMTNETYVSLVGRWQERLESQYNIQGPHPVTPMDLLVDFDVVVGDRSMPGANDVGAHNKLFEMMIKSPQTAQALNIDLSRYFRFIARENGAKNIEEFMIQAGPQTTEVADNEEVVRQAEKGNIVPIQEVANV